MLDTMSLGRSLAVGTGALVVAVIAVGGFFIASLPRCGQFAVDIENRGQAVVESVRACVTGECSEPPVEIPAGQRVRVQVRPHADSHVEAHWIVRGGAASTYALEVYLIKGSVGHVVVHLQGETARLVSQYVRTPEGIRQYFCRL